MKKMQSLAGSSASPFPTVDLEQIELDPDLTQLIPYNIAKTPQSPSPLSAGPGTHLGDEGSDSTILA